MKLRFCARGTHKVTDPMRPPRTGAPACYVGRVWDPELRAHPATSTPYEVAPGPAADRLKKVISRDATLWAFDAATASACGVEFVPIKFTDGEWVAASQKKPATAAAPAAGDS